MIPNEILRKIILQQIVLLKNINGWYDIHYIINNLNIVLKLTVFQFPYEMKYNKVIRSTVPENSVQILKRNKWIWNNIKKKINFDENHYEW